MLEIEDTSIASGVGVMLKQEMIKSVFGSGSTATLEISFVSKFAIPRLKKIGAQCAKTRR